MTLLMKPISDDLASCDLTQQSGRLKFARLSRDMSQEELAVAVGISQPSINALETRPKARTRHIVELARALQTDVDWLLYGRGAAPGIDNGEEGGLDSSDPSHADSAMEAFGKRITLAIDAAGLEDNPVKLFGVSQPMIWAYKNGLKMPRMAKASHIANVLGVNVNWLLTGAGPMSGTAPVSDAPSLNCELSALQQAVLEMAARVMRTGKLSDAECVKLLGQWQEKLGHE